MLQDHLRLKFVFKTFNCIEVWLLVNPGVVILINHGVNHLFLRMLTTSYNEKVFPARQVGC